MRTERQKKQFATLIILVTVVLSMTLVAIPAVAGEKQIEKSAYTVVVGLGLWLGSRVMV